MRHEYQDDLLRKFNKFFDAFVSIAKPQMIELAYEMSKVEELQIMIEPVQFFPETVREIVFNPLSFESFNEDDIYDEIISIYTAIIDDQFKSTQSADPSISASINKYSSDIKDILFSSIDMSLKAAKEEDFAEQPVDFVDDTYAEDDELSGELAQAIALSLQLEKDTFKEEHKENNNHLEKSKKSVLSKIPTDTDAVLSLKEFYRSTMSGKFPGYFCPIDELLEMVDLTAFDFDTPSLNVDVNVNANVTENQFKQFAKDEVPDFLFEDPVATIEDPFFIVSTGIYALQNGDNACFLLNERLATIKDGLAIFLRDSFENSQVIEAVEKIFAENIKSVFESI